jgi:hypothetical protein
VSSTKKKKDYQAIKIWENLKCTLLSERRYGKASYIMIPMMASEKDKTIKTVKQSRAFGGGQRQEALVTGRGAQNSIIL